MGVQFQFLAMALLTSAAFLMSDAGRLAEVRKESINPVPIELGGVEGKSYYVQFLVQMNWFEARDYCDSQSLTLATVETETQLEFLIKAMLPRGGFALWTAARESRQASMFVWDRSDGLQPNASVLTVWGDQKYYEPYHHCAYFWANGTNSQMWTDICEDGWRKYVLCQKIW